MSKNLILQDYSSYIFISPHLDDAILSCGNLLLKLKAQNKNIQIITLFTSASKKTLTPQAENFLNACGYTSPIKLFEDREVEDSKATGFIGGTYKHLGFIDAAWRTKNNKPLYHNGTSQFSGRISTKDHKLIDTIRTNLTKICVNDATTLILCPLGVGNHADHVITRKAVEKLYKQSLFWEDYPYNTDRGVLKMFLTKHKKFRKSFEIHQMDNRKKHLAIKFYRSQLRSLFPSGQIKNTMESYYVPKNSKLS